MDPRADPRAMDDKKQAIMAANNLDYKFDDILNVSVNRTMKKQYFDTRTYTQPGAGNAISTWNSGVDLVDVKNSYLKFRMVVNGGTGAYSFGSGSAMNLIREVKILSSSGIELARTQDANIRHKFWTDATKSTNWQSTVGVMMGRSQAPAAIATGGNGNIYVIPLCELDPFFALYDGKLLPHNIASGLRIEITWEDLNTTIVWDGATGAANATGYTIDQIEFRTESVTLADSAMSVLNKEASTNGLEVTYDRIYTTSKVTGTAATENVEVRKAVSLAKTAFCVALPTANRTSLSLDSFIAESHDFTSSDMRLGNQYYPFQPIESKEEGYFHYLKCFNKIKRDHAETNTTLANFSTGGRAMVIANFETDDSLNLTGLPINSSRILEVRFTRTTAAACKTYVFLCYTALCRASLSNVSVKI